MSRTTGHVTRCRIAAKLTEEQVAKRTGFCLDYIRTIERLAARRERGEAVILPSYNAMMRYAFAIGRNIEIFFTKGEGANTPVNGEAEKGNRSQRLGAAATKPRHTTKRN